MENTFENLKRLVHESTGLVLENSVPVFLSSNEFAGAIANMRSAMLFGKVLVTSSLNQASRWLVFSLAGKIVQVVDLQTVSQLSDGIVYHDRPVVFQNGFDILFDEVYLSANLAAVSNYITAGVIGTAAITGTAYNAHWHLSAQVASVAPNAEGSLLIGLNTSVSDPVSGDQGSTFIQPTTVDGTGAVLATTKWIRPAVYGFPFQWFQTGTWLIRSMDGNFYWPDGSDQDFPISAICPVPGGTFDVYALHWTPDPAVDMWESYTFVGCVNTEVWYRSYGLNALMPGVLGGSTLGAGAIILCWNGVYRLRVNQGAGTIVATVRKTTTPTTVTLTWTCAVDANGYFDLTLPARPALSSHYGHITFTYTAAPPPGVYAKIIENSRSSPLTIAVNGNVVNLAATTTSPAVPPINFTEPSTLQLVSDTTLVHQIHVMNGATVIAVLYIGGAHGTTKSISAISGFTKLKFLP